MTRTDLIALADRLKLMSRAIQETADSEPEARFCLDPQDSADLMIQIAQAQPVAWRFEVRFCEPNPVSEWSHYNTTTSHEAALRSVSRCYGGIEGRAVPLYPLPLED